MKPENVKAWIVAVEAYDATDIGVEIGQRALQLARMLRDKGVPASNIAVSISPVDYHNHLQGLSNHVTGATQGELLDAVAKAKGGELLLVYWIGHGVKDADHHLLLCSDTTHAEPRTVVIDRLLGYLRAKEFAKKQIAFFDCCAELVGSAGSKLSPQAGKGAPAQFCFFSAASGERAEATLKPSGFTGTVLAELAASFPPDPESLFDSLKAKFKTLRASGALGTRPVESSSDPGPAKWSRESSSPSSEPLFLDEARRAKLDREALTYLCDFAAKCPSLSQAGRNPPSGLQVSQDLAGAPRAANLLSQAIAADKMDALLTDLRQTEVGLAAVELLAKGWSQLTLFQELEKVCLELGLYWHQWLAVAARTREIGSLSPVESESLAGLHLHFLDHGELHYARFLELAGRQAQTRRPAAAVALVNLLQNHPVLGKVYASAKQGIPAARLHLQIGLDYDKNTKAASISNVWWHWSGVETLASTQLVPAAASLADQVRALIQEALQQAPDDLVVELLSPNELLCLPRELLSIDDEDFGAEWLEESHPVVLRWHPRLKGETRYEPGTWANLSRQVRATLLDKPICLWFDATQVPEVGANCHLAMLSYVGPGPMFLRSVRSGGPYMCWPRSCDTSQALRDEAGHLVQQHCLAELPKALQKQKAGTLGEMVLFVDEPERNPYATQKFQNTPQRGENS